MIRFVGKILMPIFFGLVINPCFTQEFTKKESKYVLYIHSYAPSYSWGDSVASGVLRTFIPYQNIILYTEYLDSKRFGENNFDLIYQLIQRKYKNQKLDLIISSDNDALNFLMKYGDDIASDIPILFCGVNNPEDYNLNTRFYGIKEGLDQDSVNQLILRIMPEIKKLYFITDSTLTSRLNLKYIQQLEPKYKGIVDFVYLTDLGLDSIYKLVPNLEEGNAIARIDVFYDNFGKPVNSDLILQEIAKRASVPIFMDAEPSFGKGIIGGIINTGVLHGSEMAKLALRFLENPDYVPPQKVAPPKDKCYFDYNIVEKFNIDPDLLPKESIIINEPTSIFSKYYKLILLFFAIVGILLVVIFVLTSNIRKRKKAELLLQQKLIEIQDKNAQLEESSEKVNEMNVELEESNANLSAVNHELFIAKNKAEESERLKSSFLANMSHEIRTPMNSIVGFSNLLSCDDLSAHERELFVNHVNKSSEHLLALIDDILELSKSEAEGYTINNEKVNINILIKEIVYSFEPKIDKTKLKLIIDYSPLNSEFHLLTDRVRVKQILSNFISNAIKFTEKGEIIVGSYLQENKKIVLYVKDSGIGIKKENLQYVFNRFWKIEDDNSKFYGGTGLGLAISKRLTELLNGEIWVESEFGKGTTFFLSLNLNNAEENDEFEINTTASVINLKDFNLANHTIAIAEDEEDNMVLLHEILKNTGAKLISFKNGQEIVHFFSRNDHENIHLVLMDLKMPKMNGFKATQLIKSKKNIPVIAQTAFATAEDLKKIKQAQFDDYIIKPIKADMLLEKIRKFIQT
ncbi:MAG: ATP-binding protein [Bacteroidales bacterium]